MVHSARVVRPITTSTQESAAPARRQDSARGGPDPGMANSQMQRLHSLITGQRKVQRMGETVGAMQWLFDQRNKRELANWQQVTVEVLIKRFGPKVGLSMKLYNKVAEGYCSEKEIMEYLGKSEALTKELHEFYRTFDVASLDKDVTKMSKKEKKLFNDNIDVLIAMLNTGFAVTQNQTKHISKVMNNKTLDSRLGSAIDKNKLSLTGYIGSTEATEALSPQQQVSTLGLDYEATDRVTKQKRTDFLLQTSSDAQEKATFEAVPQTSYMKIPYTKALKQATQMTLDVRFYEKILERAKGATKEGSTLTLGGDKAIAEMAKQICMKPVCLKYKIADSESEEEVATKSKEYSDRLGKPVSADKPPFTGLGFSAHGERLNEGFLNLYPEMNIATEITKANYKQIVGSNKSIEFYTKFAKTNNKLNTKNPDGSTDILIGTWDGKEVNLSDNAQAEYESNFSRVTEKFTGNEKNTELLNNNRLHVDKLQKRLAEARLKSVHE